MGKPPPHLIAEAIEGGGGVTIYIYATPTGCDVSLLIAPQHLHTLKWRRK